MPSVPASRTQKIRKGGGGEGHHPTQDWNSKSQKESGALLAWGEEGPRTTLKEGMSPNTAFHETRAETITGNA